jgi:MerR family transcriptional regulator, light-induced transcriptional regulator
MDMGRTARAGAAALPAIDRHCIRQLETHFIAPDIYRREDVSSRQAKLARVVSGEIVPRLLQLHTEVVADVPPVAVIDALAPSSDDITGLADIVLGSDLEAAVSYVTLLRERGLTTDALFVGLLEPTARCLGEMWERDACDFIDVTLGVGRLQKLLAIFNRTHDVPQLHTRRRVLMATTPGDQHSFGAMMVERFLLAAGWQVQAVFSGTAPEIVEAARRDWFAVAGLTAGSERQLDTVTALIVELRATSLNRGIGIIVGGPMFTARPGLADRVGADGTAINAPAAVLMAQKLFDRAGHGAR